MKAALTLVLSALGYVLAIVGKFGSALSLVAWIAGIIGLIPAVSFGYFLTFMLIFVLGLVCASASAVIALKL